MICRIPSIEQAVAWLEMAKTEQYRKECLDYWEVQSSKQFSRSVRELYEKRQKDGKRK